MIMIMLPHMFIGVLFYVQKLSFYLNFIEWRTTGLTLKDGWEAPVLEGWYPNLQPYD